MFPELGSGLACCAWRTAKGKLNFQAQHARPDPNSPSRCLKAVAKLESAVELRYTPRPQIKDLLYILNLLNLPQAAAVLKMLALITSPTI